MALDRVEARDVKAFLWKHAVIPVVPEGEDPPVPIYARLRTGSTRKDAISAWNRTITGGDDKTITGYAGEVVDRHARSGEGGWLEILAESGKKVIDTLTMGRPTPDLDGTDPVQADLANPAAMAQMALVAMTGHARLMGDRAAHLEVIVVDLYKELAVLTGRAVSGEALLAWRDAHGDSGSSEVVAAIEAAAPYLGPAAQEAFSAFAAKYADAKKPPKAKKKPATPDPAAGPATEAEAEPTVDERITALLVELDDLLDHHGDACKVRAMEFAMRAPKLKAVLS